MTQDLTAPERLRVLVTGFGPFPGAPFNPSGWLIEQLLAFPPELPPNTSLTGHVLQTSWDYVDRYFEHILGPVMPHVAIHFGLHQSSGAFRIETRARNQAARMPDCEGAYSQRPRIVAGAPNILSTPLPHWPFTNRLAMRRIPFAVSRDAGQYLCNHLYYLSLWNARRAAAPRLSCFVHIPQISRHPANRSRRSPYHQRAELPPEDLILGASEIVTCAVQIFRGRFARADAADATPVARPLDEHTDGGTDGYG